MQEGEFTIVLGGETIVVPPLNIGQLIDMVPALGDQAELLRIALGEAKPGITKAEIRQMKGVGVRQLATAVRTVLIAAGFVDAETAKPGEGGAATV